jgi:hypothetical protein
MLNMNLSAVAMAVVTLFATAPTADAAPCSVSGIRSLERSLVVFQRDGARCAGLAESRASRARVCTACGQFVVRGRLLRRQIKALQSSCDRFYSPSQRAEFRVTLRDFEGATGRFNGLLKSGCRQ